MTSISRGGSGKLNNTTSKLQFILHIVVHKAIFLGRVKSKLAPRSTRDILQSDYFTFTVVRHPFDRVLSAYRDRILKGCTYQAKTHIPKMLGSSAVKYDKKGCVSTFPTFRQFVEYIITDKGRDADHWNRYSVACAPCLVSYDAIVKLETSEEDEVIRF